MIGKNGMQPFNGEKDLQERCRRFVYIFNQFLHAILILDSTWKVSYINPEFERMTGYAAGEVLGRDFEFFAGVGFGSKDFETIRRELFQGSSWSGHLINRRKDGKVSIVDAILTPLKDTVGNIVNIVVFERDISKEILLEERLAQSKKLEGIGSVAGGIAHEINNPAQFIKDNATFLKDAFAELFGLVLKARVIAEEKGSGRQVSKSRMSDFQEMIASVDIDFLIEEVPKAIEDTLEGIERITQIALAMKEFSHPGEKKMEPVDINRMIDRAILVSKGEWKYTAEVEMDLDKELKPMLGYPSELNQVFLNLIVNAVHSIEEKKLKNPSYVGRIVISTQKKNGAVMIKVMDTGMGILPEDAPRVFEPFFTTKSSGKGTGQGLSISKSVIEERHGGTITFESEPGIGTVFCISIPRV